MPSTQQGHCGAKNASGPLTLLSEFEFVLIREAMGRRKLQTLENSDNAPSRTGQSILLGVNDARKALFPWSMLWSMRGLPRHNRANVACVVMLRLSLKQINHA